jgi:ribonuclease HI
LLQQQQLHERIIYSDSVVAIGWVKKKKCGTKLEHTRVNSGLFDLIHRAERWLENSTYKNPILKWETEDWGEIPADFGRK